MLALNPRKSALVLIDLQQGVVGMSLAPHAPALFVANGVALARRFSAAGGTVVLVRVAFAASGVDRLSRPVDEPMRLSAGGPPPGWSDLVPEVAALQHDVAIVKRQWGAFYGTELDLQLRRRGVDTVVLAGIATNFGVEGTAREAWQHNYAVVFAEDAMSAPTAEHHRFAVEKIFPRLGLVRSTKAILAALTAE
jgi:nicotinamidase-related amidase